MLIVIDAGHGPETSGKRTPDGSMREYQFNSAVAEYCRQELASYKGVTVKFVHSDSRDVPLAERVRTANSLKADVYVSIHANAAGSGWNSAEGIETFVSTNASTASKALAAKVQSALIAETGRKNRGVKTEAFYVIKNTNMPAILVECGFMTNQAEAALLKSDDYRHKCAKAIVRGLAEQFGLKYEVVTPKKEVASEVVDNRRFRLMTGTFVGEEAAEKMAQMLRDKYKWTVYVQEDK